MSQGPIDHPSYLTRQQICLGLVTAGGSKTQQLFAAPASNIRFRVANALVNTAGTGATATVALFAIGTGTQFPIAGSTSTITTTFTTTATLGTLTASTSAAGTVLTLPDLNVTLNQGGRLVAVTGADATLQVALDVEAYVDPLSAWTGN